MKFCTDTEIPDLVSNQRKKTILKILFLLAFTSTNVLAEPTRVPGTTITMDPPAGFELAKEFFTGFQDSDTMSSIVFLEMPDFVHDEIASTLSDLESAKEEYAKQEIEITSLFPIKIEDKTVNLAKGNHTSQDTNRIRYITVLEGKQTVLVMVDLQDQVQLSEADLIASLESISLSSALSLAEKMENLNYTFAEKEPFFAVEVYSGQGVVLSIHEDIDVSANSPAIAIIPFPADVSASNIKDISSTMLDQYISAQLEKDNSLIAEDGEMVDIENGQAYRMEAHSESESVIQYLIHYPGKKITHCWLLETESH